MTDHREDDILLPGFFMDAGGAEMNGKRRIARGIVRGRGWLTAGLLLLAVLCVFTIGKTRINYDLTRYLDRNTMTRRALDVMAEEFGSPEQLRIMFTDLPAEEMQAVTDRLREMEEIRLVSYDPEENTRQAEGKTLRLVTLTLREGDGTALVEKLRSMFPGAGEYAVGGSAAEQLDVQRSVGEEMPLVMLISVGIVLLVLLLTSHAWLEPAVILLTLGVSILINMGTNFVFPDVSFITFAVCAILQLALSIDYAIMLLHTWNGCCDRGMDAKDAMTEALAQCFMRIASSALTTVAGLLSLLFMSFTIGFDIGMVLSKGIVISMLCVFLFMPGLVLLMERPLRATRHKPLSVGGARLAKFILRAGKPLALVLTAAVIFAAVLSAQNRFSFSAGSMSAKTETARINEVFGASDPLVILVPGGETDGDYDRQRETAERLLGLRRENGEPAVKHLTAMVTDGAEALKYYTAKEAAELTGMPEETVSLFFLLQGFGERVRADRLLEAAGAFAAGNEALEGLRGALDTARSALEGPRYARMLAETGFRSSDSDFNACMDAVLAAVRETYGDDFYVTGASMSTYDIGKAFSGDLLKVNLITLLSILMIVTVSFRSFRMPALLVFVIEGAIWITMGISRVMGQEIFFISYLICLSIQMGATIDYGILMCDQFRSLRGEGKPAAEALTEAIRRSLPTVLTSGIILVTAGYFVGRLCSIYYISSIGSLLSRGALVSVILVLTLLPSLLGLMSRGEGFCRAGNKKKNGSP